MPDSWGPQSASITETEIQNDKTTAPGMAVQSTDRLHLWDKLAMTKKLNQPASRKLSYRSTHAPMGRNT